MPIDHKTSPGNYQNLFVAKLPPIVTDADLLSIFAPFAPISATVMLDPVTGRSKGFAFVLFPSESDGRRAAAAMDKQTASAPRRDNPFTFVLTLFPSKHTGKEVATENECLYIRNIPNSWPMPVVEAYIGRHGKPVYSAVRNDHLGSPVWVVFVEYDSVEGARNTLHALHGTIPFPNAPPILAKFAENDDVKKMRRNRKLGCPNRINRLQADPSAGNEDVFTAIVSEGSYNVSALAYENAPRITVTQQVHNPCHATHYDVNGDRMDQTLPPTPKWDIPLPRSQGGLGNGRLTSLPVPRSQQQSPMIDLNRLTPMLGGGLGGSIRSVASTSMSSNSSKAGDSVRPSKGSGRRFQYNPYSISNSVSIQDF